MSEQPRDTPTPASVERPLCVDATGLARMLDVSTRTVYRLADAGQLPAAINLRGCKRWYVAAVEAWLRDGGPRRRSRA